MAKARRGVAIWRRTISFGGSSRARMLNRAVSGTRGRMMRAASRISAALSGVRGCGAAGGPVRQAASAAMRMTRTRRTGFQGNAVGQTIGLCRLSTQRKKTDHTKRWSVLQGDLETNGVVARLLGRERDAQGPRVLGELEVAAMAQQFQATDFCDREF